MQRLKTVLCIVTTSLGLLSLNAYADDWQRQPRGFNSYLSSVVEIQKQGRDDDLVVLQGRLTNYLGKNNYEFTDIKGDSIEVELDDDLDWSRVHRDQLITIKGKVEKNMFTMQVEAKHYSILTDLSSVNGSSNAQVATVIRTVTTTTSAVPQVKNATLHGQSQALAQVAPPVATQAYAATPAFQASPSPASQSTTPAVVAASTLSSAIQPPAPRSNAVLSLEEFVEQAKNEVKGHENAKQSLAQQERQERDMRRGYINLAQQQSQDTLLNADTLSSDTPIDPMFQAAYSQLSKAVLNSEPSSSGKAKYSSFVTSNTEHLPSHEAAQALVSNGNRINANHDVVNSLRHNEQAPSFDYTYTSERRESSNAQPLPTIQHGAENSNLPMIIDSTVSEIQSKIRSYQQD